MYAKMSRQTGKERMERIVFLGKGGIGKSTILANLGVIYAGSGHRVLIVGCDPKHDVSMLLTNRTDVPTIVSQLSHNNRIDTSTVVLRGRAEIDCIEAGGPEPGVGCAGRGISRMLEFFGDTDLFRKRGYDIILFDLLGDIVCGGFATPLRKGFGEKVFIVCSDELMSLYAANNIARAVRTYSVNGAVLGGLIANLKDPHADERMISGFARAINTRVVTTIKRDPSFRKAEYKRLTLAEFDPSSPTVKLLKSLAGKALKIVPGKVPLPTPLTHHEFYTRAAEGFSG
jgi:nitrogenase iron protein NifH